MQHSKQPGQQFDDTLKALFGNEVADILPRLLPDKAKKKATDCV
jgi:hypothetical protein